MVRIIVIISIFLLLISCYVDVPHDAKYDPLNPFAKGQIIITVNSLNNEPIENVSIVFNNKDTLYTDEYGSTLPVDFVHDTIHIDIFKEHYESIEIDTVLYPGDNLSINVNLNFIPEFISKNVNSIVLKKVGLIDTMDYFVNYTVTLLDKDAENNIDSIVLLFPDTNLYMQFDTNIADTLFYSYSINENNSPINIFDIEGIGVNVKVYENKNNVYDYGELFLVRFVTNIANILNPENGNDFLMPDTIKWENQTETYRSYINLRIVNNNDTIFSLDSLDIAINEYYMDTIFSSGEYNLYIRIYDLFNNYSQNCIYFTVP